jgi:hypothetical protein
MNKLTLGAVTAAAASAAVILASAPGRAQNYPWCLVISDKTGSMTCYFTTREQCMMSTGGNVGFCMRNPAVPDPPPRRRSER